MKRLIGCIATLVCLALVIGGLVWLVGAKASPAKTLMKEHPYVFETAKAVGDEVQDSFAQGLGCGYVAYPKTKNDQTNETVKQVVDTAKKRFNEYVTQVESMEDYDLIPRVIVDYKTDRVRDPEELLERHSKQLELYAMAVEKIAGKPVVKTCIWSFFMNKEIVFMRKCTKTH